MLHFVSKTYTNLPSAVDTIPGGSQRFGTRIRFIQTLLAFQGEEIPTVVSPLPVTPTTYKITDTRKPDAHG